MNENIALLVAGVIISIQSWILLEIVRLKVSLGKHDDQIGRFLSDVESEKDTRKRVHQDFERRLRALEIYRKPSA